MSSDHSDAPKSQRPEMDERAREAALADALVLTSVLEGREEIERAASVAEDAFWAALPGNHHGDKVRQFWRYSHALRKAALGGSNWRHGPPWVYQPDTRRQGGRATAATLRAFARHDAARMGAHQ